MTSVNKTSWWGLLLTLSLLVQSARADVIRKFDGSEQDGSLVEVRGNEVVFAPATDPAAQPITLPYRDLSEIHFRAGEWDSKFTKVVAENRGEAKAVNSGTIKLRAGRHWLGLAYWHTTGANSLVVEMSGPGLEQRKLSTEQLFRPAPGATGSRHSQGFDAEGFLDPLDFTAVEPGVNACVTEWSPETEFHAYSELKEVRPARYATTKHLDLKSFKHASTHFGVLLYGMLQVPTDGEYTLSLITAGNAQLWIGRDPACVHPFSGTLVADDFQVNSIDGGTWSGKLGTWTPEKLAITMSLGAVTTNVDAPIEMLQEIWSSPVALQDVKVDRSGEPASEDSVYVRVGDSKEIQRVAGRVLGVEGDSLQIEHEGQKRGLKMDRLVGVVFRGHRAKLPPAQGVVALVGSHRFPGQLVRAQRGQDVVFQTLWGQEITQPYNHVVRYYVRNRRSVSLADLTPTAEELTPYFDRSMKWTADKSLDGRPLKIGDKTYTRGLGMHSRTVLTYDLGGQFSKFESDVGLQDESGKAGNVACRVLTDGEVAFEKADLTTASGVQTLSIDVTGKKTLTLEVDFGENFDVGDHVSWGDPQLKQSQP